MYSEYYLAHHGIKGMKWGVRRYQNKDGSYTSAGRKRYDIGVEKAHKQFSHNRSISSQEKRKLNQYRKRCLKYGLTATNKDDSWYKNASYEQLKKDRNLKRIYIGAMTVGVAGGISIAAYNSHLSKAHYANVGRAKILEMMDVPLEDLSSATEHISKGTKFQRIIRDRNLKGEDTSKLEPLRDITWNTFKKDDNRRYMKFFNDRGSGAKNIYTREAKYDLTGASERQRVMTFMQLMSTDNVVRDAVYDAAAKRQGIRPQDVPRSITRTRDLYYDFEQALAANFDVQKSYANKMISKGFDFSRDDMDTRVLGNHPVILLNTRNSTSILGKKRVTIVREIFDGILVKGMA